MTKTTTIEITVAQKGELDNIGGSSYKEAVQELIDYYRDAIDESEGVNENRMREIAQQEINDMVVREALQ